MTEQTSITPRLLTKAQAAAYCGVSLPNFDRLRRLGTLPNRVEGMLRWDRVALDAAIDKLSGAPKEADPPSAADEAWEKWKKGYDGRRAARKRAKDARL